MARGLTAKARVELEKRFLGSIIEELNDNYSYDIREKIARYGISWRRFRDKRHRVLWRAFETLELRTTYERQQILMDEEEADPGREVFRKDGSGAPGTAAWRAFEKKLEECSGGLAWLERELEAAGALRLIGGKKYLRDIAATVEESMFISLAAYTEDLMRQLGFM